MEQSCSLNLTVELITAWQDAQLDQSAMSRIGAHIGECPHCQAYLQDFAQIKSALIAIPEPDLRQRIWHIVQAGVRYPPRRILVPAGVWRGAISIASVIVLITLFVQVLHFAGKHTKPISLIPTATLTPTMFPTIAATTIPRFAGWTPSDPTFATSLAFAASDHLIGYACGIVPGIRASTPKGLAFIEGNLPLGVTHDGGTTWQTITTTVVGTTCGVMVDPTDARDLVMDYNTCLSNCMTGSNMGLARSRDGGQTWTELSLPTSLPATAAILPGMMAWVGATFYVAIPQDASSGTNNSVILLRSAQTDTLEPVAVTGAMSSIPASANFTGVVGAGNSLFLIFTNALAGNSNEFQEFAAVTGNGGATWTHFPLSHNGLALHIVNANATGSLLFGEYLSPDGPQPPGLPTHLPLLVSTDGGYTWQQTPTPANGEFFLHGFRDTPFAAPDGTLVAMCHIYTTNSFGIYTLAPGANAWVYRAPATTGMLMGVSVDANGHPIRMWGRAGANSQDILNGLPGLQYFSLR